MFDQGQNDQSQMQGGPIGFTPPPNNMAPINSALETPAPQVVSTPAPQSAPQVGATSGPSQDLLSIKQEALGHLSPLVSHLDQSAEEKFRTTMMMIQATDNQDLVKEAFEAAKQITDDKARAQALLDIINEINYFTQDHHSQNN